MTTTFNRFIIIAIAALLAILAGATGAQAESTYCPHENIRVELVRAVLTFNKAKCVYRVNLAGYPVADFCNGIAPQGTRTVKAVLKSDTRIKCVWKKTSGRTPEGFRFNN